MRKGRPGRVAPLHSRGLRSAMPQEAYLPFSRVSRTCSHLNFSPIPLT